MLRLEQVTKRYGDHTVLDGISFSVQEGEVVAVIGPSGSGKSTLLRCINFLETPSEGSIWLAGDKICEQGAGRGDHLPSARQLMQLRRKIGFVFQSFNLFPHMTALENIVLAQIHTLGLPKDEARTRGKDLLRQVGLPDKADAHPTRLSGGQQQRIAIARALALEPVLMLFDEPTSALDPEMRGEVLDVLRRLAANGMTMMISTHEMRFAADVAHHVMFIADAQVVEQGPPAEVLKNPQHQRTRQFLQRILEA
jgi:polar amino acid transport system ATP-binding protein